ncbi:hypothetical protein [cf. Phormidesmis sp. LEGE 11477]|uniref:hypothetical protein n=1 Tax=cf. Phormidesmis sp. LEGE 11477 TaxID=1828680 RepID=UPI0018810322|nr:hypothetical protein [cf. Phormidesmis sp. LEGE 11477]MBE9064584.1 hypothetical protein [cf. Phormidesmis sp. LEGE 11477]
MKTSNLKLYVQVVEAQAIPLREDFWFRLLSEDLRLNPISIEPQIVQEYVHILKE